jgi:hypothetical protein
MGSAALKPGPKRKMFHATLHVTRVEEWSVEAESIEEGWTRRTQSRWPVPALRGRLDRRVRALEHRSWRP